MRSRSKRGPVRSTQRGRAALPSLDQLSYRRRIDGARWLRRGLLWIGLPSAVWAGRHPLWLFGVFVAILLLHTALGHWELSLRRQFIRDAQLPSFLIDKVGAAYPHLKRRDAELVLVGLRQFFMAHLRSRRRFVAMPSKIVDAAWHEFILHTRAYEVWCRTAFGGLLHHSPAEVLGRDARRNDGLRRSWYWACKEESIDPRRPSRLPLLFALDTKFDIPGGFRYMPDCHALDRHAGSHAHCGSDFGNGGDAGGEAGGDADGFGGCESSDADGSCGGDGGCGGD